MRGVGVACTVGRHDGGVGGFTGGGGVDVTAGGMNTSATQENDSARRDRVVGVGVVSSQSAKLRKQTWDVDDKKNGRRTIPLDLYRGRRVRLDEHGPRPTGNFYRSSFYNLTLGFVNQTRFSLANGSGGRSGEISNLPNWSILIPTPFCDPNIRQQRLLSLPI